MSRRVGLRHRLALPVCCELLLNASLMRGDAVSLFGLVAKLTPGWQVGPWIRVIVERRWLRCSRACAMIMVVCCLGVIYSIRRPIAPILRSTPHLAVVYRSTVLSLSLTIGGRGGSGALICRQMGCRRGRFLDSRVRLSTLHPQRLCLLQGAYSIVGLGRDQWSCVVVSIVYHFNQDGYSRVCSCLKVKLAKCTVSLKLRLG
mmetsp:Transcript_978/g.1529  ORF Transcript_978/g.1529 Transcript_978/m.1529 type:complete len:202 (+) Transcript_978:1070-1675(+)